MSNDCILKRRSLCTCPVFAAKPQGNALPSWQSVHFRRALVPSASDTERAAAVGDLSSLGKKNEEEPVAVERAMMACTSISVAAALHSLCRQFYLTKLGGTASFASSRTILMQQHPHLMHRWQSQRRSSRLRKTRSQLPPRCVPSISETFRQRHQSHA